MAIPAALFAVFLGASGKTFGCVWIGLCFSSRRFSPKPPFKSWASYGLMTQLIIGFKNTRCKKHPPRRAVAAKDAAAPPRSAFVVSTFFMLVFAGSATAAKQKGFECQRPPAQRLLLACALTCALLLHTCSAAPLAREDGASFTSRACVKYASALESALQRKDEARAQNTISDFFSTQRHAALKHCFLFRAGVAFHSLGDSASCWTMFSAFFDAFPNHEHVINADSLYADSYAKGGTCAAIEGHIDAAASLLQLAVRLQPRDSHSWNNLANVYRSAGLTQQALDA